MSVASLSAVDLVEEESREASPDGDFLSGEAMGGGVPEAWGPGRDGENRPWTHDPKPAPPALPDLRGDPHSAPQLSVQSRDFECPLGLRRSR